MSEEKSKSNSTSPQSNFNSQGIMIFLGIIIAGAIIAAAIVYSSQINKTGPTPNVANEGGSVDQKAARAALVEELGLNVDDYNQCVESSNSDEIKKDIADAQQVGATGTPSFIVGKSDGQDSFKGQLVVGALPAEIFVEVLDRWINEGQPTNVDAIFNPDDQEALSKVPELVDVSVDDDPSQGDSEAPVTLIEFSDYECPFCQRFVNDAYQKIKSDYIDTGKVRHVFRDLPLQFHDPVATDAAIAANCVREQGGDEKYFEFHDLYFKNTVANGKGL